MPTTAAQSLRVRRGGSRVAHFISKVGKAYSLDLTPEHGQLGGVAFGLVEIARPGRKALVRLDAPQLRTLHFEHTVVGATGGGTVSSRVLRLVSLAHSGSQVRLVGVSGVETGTWWRIKDFVVDIVERNPDQGIKQATLTWSLQEANDARPKISRTAPPDAMFGAEPVQPGISPGTPSSNTPAAGSGGNDATPWTPRVSASDPHAYTTKARESLYDVAAHFYGNGESWPAIATANNIKADRYLGASIGLMPLKAGTVLYIPDRGPTSTAGPSGTGF